MTFDPLAFVPLQRGSRDTSPSGPVHRLQGWLALHGYVCTVDGDFGPETERALEHFQLAMEHVPTVIRCGMLCETTWANITAPLARAMAPLQCPHAPGMPCAECMGGPTFGDVVAKVARQWLAQSVGGGPLRELPGNSGPAVEDCTRWLAERDRLPCFCGHEYKAHVGPREEDDWCVHCPCREYAPDWRLPWCAGWVSTVLRQACESLGVPMPLKGSLSCDELARQAQEAKLWPNYRSKVSGARPVAPGDIALRIKGPGDWDHALIVDEVLEAGWWGIAGNTSSAGSRDGRIIARTFHRWEHNDHHFICWRSA